MYTMMKRKNNVLRDEVLNLTQRLVQTPSPSLDESDVADVVYSALSELSYDRVHRDEAGNVMGIITGRDNAPTLLLNAHMDTVGASGEEWDGSPFEAEVVEGRLRGLGASDCKGGLAAIIYAGELLKRCMLPFRGNLVVAATVAEENGRSLGVRTLLQETLPEFHLEPDYAVLAEPTDLRLFHGHDGWAELEVSLDGDNPFHVRDAARAVSRELESTLGSAKPDDDGNVVEFAWMEAPTFDQDDGQRSARIRLDRRLRQSEEISDVLQRLHKEVTAASRAPASVRLQVEVAEQEQKLYTGRTLTVKNVTEAWETDPFNELVERARQTLHAAGLDPRPGKWNLRKLRMGTAGSVLVNDFNIPTVGFGPGNEAEAHSVNECVEVDNIHQAVYGLASIAHGLVGVPVFGWTSDEI